MAGASDRRHSLLIEIKANSVASERLAAQQRSSTMKAADVMTRPVLTVTPDGTIAEAARLMLERHVSGLPVLDGDGKIVGMLTEGDLLRRAETGTERHRPRWLELIIGPGRLARDYVDTHARRIAEVMTGDVITVTPQTELPDLVQLMENSHIKRVPVVDCGRLVGIVSRADLVHAMLGILTDSTSGASSGDDEIRNRILGEISVQPWGPRANVYVILYRIDTRNVFGAGRTRRKRSWCQCGKGSPCLGGAALRDVYSRRLTGPSIANIVHGISCVKNAKR